MADKDKKNEEVVVTPGPRSMVVPGNDLTGYIGVSPEYMNYANATEKPILTEAEAHLFTDLTDEEIEATRTHESDFENEGPAVVEGGYDSGVAATRYAEVEGMTADPSGHYTHPLVFEDDENGLTGEEKADIAQGVKKSPEADSKGDSRTEGEEPSVSPVGTRPTFGNN